MRKRILHPAVLFSLVWLVVISAHLFFSFTVLDELPPLSITTYLVFFIGALSFSLGAFIETIMFQKGSLVTEMPALEISTGENKISNRLLYILLAIVVAGLPFFLQASYRIFIASNIDNFFVGLRSELLYGDEDIGPLKYLFAFSLVVFAFVLQSSLKKQNLNGRILVIIGFISTMIYAVFMTGRLLFLFVLAVYLGMRFIHGRSFSTKKVFGLAALFMIVFIIFGVVYGKGGNIEGSAYENMKPAAEGTAIYMVASLNALDKEMQNPFLVNYNGNNSLRFFLKVAKTLNIIPNAEVSDLIPDFVLVPYPTNVYTMYSPYIRDFGIVYAWLIVAFLGFLQAYLFNKAIEKKTFRFSFWYSLLLFPLIISFFADQYFSLLSFWIQFAVFIEAVILLNKLFTSRKW
ncbi:MAG: O-antigen polymerase [Ginsengibacter sp.]